MAVIKRQNQKIIDRLMMDHAFLKIRELAKVDKDNLDTYVTEVRTKFSLSPYWDEILSWLLTHDGLATDLPLTGSSVDSHKDPVTGKTYYSVPVYPETTDANIRSSAKLIRDRYKDRGESVDIRAIDTKKATAEFRALELHESGKTNPEILESLEAEFDEAYIINDIPLLIRAAKKKSMRQENVS